MSDEPLQTHQPCPDCNSSDALSVYDDHTHCFSCGVHKVTKGDETASVTPKSKGNKKDKPLLPPGEVRSLSARSLHAETLDKFGYTISTYGDKPVQIAPYHDANGKLVAQKVRFPDKSFMVTGDISDAPLFGQRLWKDGGKRLVITEGEIDAMSYAQASGLTWPVVSIPNGADGARKSIQKNIDWIEKFDEVVFLFDMDEPGQEAAKKCAALLTPGKAKIGKMPLKDANEMLKADRVKELLQAVWNAQSSRPDGLIRLSDIRASILKPVEWGLPWPWPSMTKMTYGRRPRELYGFGAATGGGKTTIFSAVATQTALPKEDGGFNEPVGLFLLETPPDELGKRLAGQVAGKRFWVPDAGWTQDELAAVVDKLDGTNNIHIYDNFGSTDWDEIKSRMRYLAMAHGVKHIFLDHLTALADPNDERASLENIMRELAALTHQLNVTTYYVSHLATPEGGKSHEEGSRVMLRHFKGARAIGFWTNFAFGLERDQQSDDPEEKLRTTMRCLKDRYTGQSTGETFTLDYDRETGRLVEGVVSKFEDTETPPWEGDGGKDF